MRGDSRPSARAGRGWEVLKSFILKKGKAKQKRKKKFLMVSSKAQNEAKLFSTGQKKR